jgi:hypothetical protein
MPEIILYGIGAVIFASLAVMVYGYMTAPDGYEDQYGFHYGRPPKVSASRRLAAVRSRHHAKYRRRAHRRKIAA